jgi:Tfp pilus assembly protein PilF
MKPDAFRSRRSILLHPVGMNMRPCAVPLVVVCIVAFLSNPLWAQSEEPQQAPPPATDHGVPAEMARNPVWLADEALKAFENDEYRRAYQLALMALQVRPDQPYALLVKGKILIADNRHREAMEPLNAYVKTPEGRNDYRGFEALGDVFLRSSKHWLAAQMYSNALPKSPVKVKEDFVRARVQVKLSQALAGRGLFREAIDAARGAVLADPNASEFQWNLASVLLKSGNAEEAIEAMNKAIELIKSDMAFLYSRLEVSIDPKAEEELIKNLGSLSHVLDAMVRAHQSAVSLASEPAPARLVALAESVAEQADIERRLRLYGSMKLMEQVVTREPTNAEWRVRLAKYQLASGFRAAAVANIEEALKIDANHEEAKALRARLVGQVAAKPTPAAE